MARSTCTPLATNFINNNSNPHLISLISTMATILFYIALSLSLLLLTKLLFSLSSSNKNKKNLPPSPPSLPILGHLHLIKNPLHRTLSLLSARHGSILLLHFGPRPVLVVSSPSLAEECFTKNDITFANRPHLHSGHHLSDNHTTLSTANYGPHWRNLRRIATVEVLSSARVHSLSASRAEEIRYLVRRLFQDLVTQPAEGLVKVELKSRLFELMLNVMMGMIAGKRYYGEDEEARRFKKIVEEGFSLVGSSNLGDFFPLLRWVDFQGLEKRLVRLKKGRKEFLQALIEEQRKKNSDSIEREEEEEEEEEVERKKTMLGVLLPLQNSDPEYYTDEVIRGIMSVSGLCSHA